MSDDDTNELLNVAVPFAQQMLAKRGAFLPFGATISTSGEVAHAHPGEGADAQDMIEILVSGFRAQAAEGSIKASALCYDSKVTVPGGEKQDTICVELEHVSDRCAVLYLPYKKAWGRLKYGELFGAAHTPRVFERTDGQPPSDEQ